MKCDPKDAELQTLLEMDGFTFWPKPRYWVKFNARFVEAEPQTPHNIKYSLTLHDRNNTRILGFDNAHAVKRRGKHRKKYVGELLHGIMFIGLIKQSHTNSNLQASS